MCDVNCIRWGAKNLTRKEIEGKRIIEVGSYDGTVTFDTSLNCLSPLNMLE
jgi:hypothetical protein